MRKNSIKWEIEGLNVDRRNASLDELKHLSNLTALQLDIEDANIVLPKSFLSRKLERYKIFIGEEWDWFDKCQSSRTLKLKLNSNICMEDLQGVNNVEYLCLDELQGIKSVLPELDKEGFSELKHLRVQNNPYFLSILDSMELVSCDAFPILESLSLYKLINLEKICGSHLRTQSFCKLRSIKVRECHKLRNIFSFSTAGCLSQLQTIKVIECKNIIEIFATGREDDVDKIVFNELRSLTLRTLPQFTSFFCEVKTASALQNRENELTNDNFSNEIISEDELDTPTSLFNHKAIFPKLEALTLSTLNFQSIWLNQLPAASSCVENLTRLIVKDCDKLKYIFSSSMVRNLVHLQHLEISNCAVLEEIVAKEGAEAAVCRFVFPQLSVLKLYDLPELKAFYPGRHTSELPALKKLKVYACEKVKILTAELISFQETDNIPAQQPLFFLAKVFPNLEDSALTGKDITVIYVLPPSASFRNLTTLEVWYCNGLKSLVTSSTARSMVCVKRMIIVECKMMTQVVANEGDDGMEGEIVFSKLKILALECLESLTSFCFGNYVLKFPSLIDLTVRKCPSMKNFFEGDLNAPKLREAWQTPLGNKWSSEGDLNTTVQYTHAKLAEAGDKQEIEASTSEDEDEAGSSQDEDDE